jgi:hypothetical protein
MPKPERTTIAAEDLGSVMVESVLGLLEHCCPISPR